MIVNWPGMKLRSLEGPIRQICFEDHKMCFLSGPRQCGKTTLAKAFLANRSVGEYRNWDDIEFRRLWTRSPRAIIDAARREGAEVPLVVLDEIHKARGWKRTLKGIFDTLEVPADLLVTGSARLNVYRRGGDSLVGRYHHLRLHPFSLHELESADTPSPDDAFAALRNHTLAPDPTRQELLDALLEFGGFPEPILRQDARKARLWRRTRVERVIREDLRDLTRLPELSRVEMLAALLPEQVGSLLSVQNLREDLEVAHETARRWLESLKELYYAFEVRPYQKRIRRTLRKAGKIYMWDYGEVPDRAARFENLIAAHLLKACHFWTDTGEGDFDLQYLRTKEQHEIDFLVIRDKQPWLPIEVKSTDTDPSPSFDRFLPQIGCPLGLQLVATPGIWRVFQRDGFHVIVASAAEALACLV